MVVMIVLGVVAWLSIPPLLSRAMRRRGYDGGSWMVVGLLLGPVGVALAVVEVLSDVPEGSRILEAGLAGKGEVSILVVLEADSSIPPPTAGLAEVSPYLRRLGLARILPKGGPRLDERRAEQTLRRAAIGLARPEIALLFGRPDLAIAAHAAAGAYDVVVTARADPLVTERLAAIGRVHWWGNDQVPVFGPGRLTATSWCPVGTEPRAATPVASVASGRRLEDVQPESTAKAGMG
jgi:hypothetical protein